MFKITEETKEAAVEAMSQILFDLSADKISAEEKSDLGEAFDAAVDIVKKQFGM